MIEITAIDTPTLGDRSYLVDDGRVAFVVDPQRDIDRITGLADERGVAITDVFETHVHNDYVTGGLALARATGAAYHVNAADTVAFDRHPVADGDAIAVGAEMRVRVLATPGHTFTHLSYVLEAPGRPPAVFTGGSLLYGSTGRPDLLGPDHTDALVHAQYGSARRLADELPDETEIFPTHGFGSFCSSTQSQAAASTIGREKRANPVLTLEEKEYVDTLLAGLDAYPAYYAHMDPANTAGPGAPDLSEPHRADAAELRRRIAAGEWVVDLRTRTAFAAGHAAGTLNFGLDGAFATYLGWLIPWGTPVTLLGETAQDVAAAQRELVRIGIDRPAAAATGGPGDWSAGAPRTLPTGTFPDLASVRHHRPVTVLDVRRDQEWAGSHIDGAAHIPLHDLLQRLDEVPAGEVWVHCQSGYRASIAASILAAAGRHVVLIDDEYRAEAVADLPTCTAA
ncbi:MBL fold metallo-hydrolase [Actinomadura verrucosospora]|uniref:Beta-lactamase domain-containing protein n=1 Tax=Actinomadura verrucosospora TaxID=46165 RepID=A0A7D4AXB2_ACTVE|nr:MBL fold metallo-hydrolase [Actinomadura verrucosospora]QKG27129.1 beta-lactamase domain-containing protein [Actinomadura verrucosospora]